MAVTRCVGRAGGEAVRKSDYGSGLRASMMGQGASRHAFQTGTAGCSKQVPPAVPKLCHMLSHAHDTISEQPQMVVVYTPLHLVPARSAAIPATHFGDKGDFIILGIHRSQENRQ